MNASALKHYIGYGLVLAALIFTGWQLFKEHEAKRDMQLQEAVQKQAKDDLQKINDDHQQATSALQSVAAKPATVESVVTLAPSKIPGQLSVQPVNGQATLTLSGDVSKNLQAIQDAEVKCQQSQIDLTAASGKVDVYEKKTIPSLQKENNDLRSLAIPRWTLTLGVSKGPDNSYKPAGFVDYRISKSWGLTAGAANNSLFGGVSLHLGSPPKASGK